MSEVLGSDALRKSHHFWSFMNVVSRLQHSGCQCRSWGIPSQDMLPLVRWGWGLDDLGKFFHRRRRRRHLAPTFREVLQVLLLLTSKTILTKQIIEDAPLTPNLLITHKSNTSTFTANTSWLEFVFFFSGYVWPCVGHIVKHFPTTPGLFWKKVR